MNLLVSYISKHVIAYSACLPVVFHNLFSGNTTRVDTFSSSQTQTLQRPGRPLGDPRRVVMWCTKRAAANSGCGHIALAYIIALPLQGYQACPQKAVRSCQAATDLCVTTSVT